MDDSWIKRDLLEISSNVKYHRAVMGLNQYELADVAGISKIVLGRIESANVFINHGIQHYMKLAKAFGIPLEELFTLRNGKGDGNANTDISNRQTRGEE